MYTKQENKKLGKFEWNQSELIAQVLHNICGISGYDEEINFTEYYADWYGLIKGKKHWFIVHESNQGFFTYKIYSIEEGGVMWKGLESEYYEQESISEYDDYHSALPWNQ